MVLDTFSTDKSFDNKSNPPLKQAHIDMQLLCRHLNVEYSTL